MKRNSFIGKEVALVDVDFGAAVNGSMGPAGAVESVFEAIQVTMSQLLRSRCVT